MVNGNAGKGDRPRPFNRKKWDEAWENMNKKQECKYCKKTPKKIYRFEWFNGVITNTIFSCPACVKKGMSPPKDQVILCGGRVQRFENR